LGGSAIKALFELLSLKSPIYKSKAYVTLKSVGFFKLIGWAGYTCLHSFETSDLYWQASQTARQRNVSIHTAFVLSQQRPCNVNARALHDRYKGDVASLQKPCNDNTKIKSLHKSEGFFIY